MCGSRGRVASCAARNSWHTCEVASLSHPQPASSVGWQAACGNGSNTISLLQNAIAAASKSTVAKLSPSCTGISKQILEKTVKAACSSVLGGAQLLGHIAQVDKTQCLTWPATKHEQAPSDANKQAPSARSRQNYLVSYVGRPAIRSSATLVNA